MSENISEIDYREVIEYSLDPLIIHTDYRIIYINKAAEEFFRTNRKEVIGASPLDIFKETSKDAIKKRIQSAYGKPADVIEETVYRMDGTTVEVELYCHPIMIDNNKAIQTYVRDITDQRETEKKQKEMTKQINELSATVVPILNEIAVLPLVGKIDEEKARSLLEMVPEKVQNQNISRLIIDFSGVYTIDNVVIDNLFKINNVLSLLGVRPILTGLRPELSIAATNLNTDLSSIPTFATVKDALSYLGVK
ncbi:PAS domain S-box-containing protein [Halobacillus dabanensis]|uniref:PAS domain S-box-containing protein n=1 Tax=Halobacillus dabanensis TaxID=240302 RepID=A0A1I3UYX3_HALDA|nr:PAS domain S-box protein [Halobacillus dabanensis]SFJ87081.1 PAS domain S-box-containing protein [Halobacillus dabanensis]